MRSIVLAIAVAILAIGGGLDRTRAADAGRPPEVAYRPVAASVPPGCRSEWVCGPWGCGWQPFCPRRSGVRPYRWQGLAVAAYDDAWCSYYGPRNSPVYLQCRENLYYERASLPLRAIK